MTKLLKLPKVAVFYDWLNQWGGAERVLLNILKIFPQADLYTLVYDPSRTPWLPPHIKIHTSFLQNLPLSSQNPVIYTPFYDLALEQFNFSAYDMVISTTSTVGHCLLTPPRTLFLTYFHNINRHLYRRRYLKFYQKIDYIYSRRPDAVACNSRTVASRIIQNYGLTPEIINPGIDTDFFTPVKNPTADYFLISSRLVKHKHISLAIEAFRQLPFKLIITGNGRDQGFLRSLASGAGNIKFTGLISDDKLLTLYQNCSALICPQLEDFGLSALEAQSCGRPVIAYGRGGNTETILNGTTGVFFNELSPKSLLSALDIFRKSALNPGDCRKQALRFSDRLFMLHFKQFTDRLWAKHQTILS